MAQLSFHSPIGDLTISEEDGYIVSLDWGWSPFSEETPLLVTCKTELDAYFDGLNPSFSAPLSTTGTDFQKQVWQTMQKIPYGKTMTYGEVATKLGSHARAVGTACGMNPIPVLIPCHRIMGQNGKLTGFSGGEGVETKRFLLDLERATSPQRDTLL
ncbi:methylated-DNA--[protein]-cysteine S-methyltransferase [Paremcibacter congregatus]|uniref:methylated-DNA--[protein]-cysteine S-methyltransferase n=1 Tax=Paremcibacter congregatus TaxID=2043170 RepID=UPI003A937573